MIHKLIQWFKRNSCKECDYYCPENNVCQSKKCATCECLPYVNWFDKHFCEAYKAESEDKRQKMEVINNVINEVIRQQKEYTERTLAEIITKYDFVVGSKECKCKLREILPEGANIICTPYIESPTTVYVFKKFNTMDLLYEPQESEEV